MAVHYLSTAFTPRTPRTLSKIDRLAIERRIERLIAMLDAIDGDVDLEDDELHDDICDMGEQDVFLTVKPQYGVDQRRGPTNFAQAVDIQNRTVCGIVI